MRFETEKRFGCGGAGGCAYSAGHEGADALHLLLSQRHFGRRVLRLQHLRCSFNVLHADAVVDVESFFLFF